MRKSYCVFLQVMLIGLLSVFSFNVYSVSFIGNGNENNRPEKSNQLPLITAFPQPAGEYVNIEIKNVNSDNITFSLFDLTGNLVMKSEIDNPSLPYLFRTTDFPSGVYFYKVFVDLKEVKTARLIINH